MAGRALKAAWRTVLAIMLLGAECISLPANDLVALGLRLAPLTSRPSPAPSMDLQELASRCSPPLRKGERTMMQSLRFQELCPAVSVPWMSICKDGSRNLQPGPPEEIELAQRIFTQSTLARLRERLFARLHNETLVEVTFTYTHAGCDHSPEEVHA